MHERLRMALSFPADWAIDTSDPFAIRLSPGAGGFVLVQSSLVGPTSLNNQIIEFLAQFSAVRDFRQLSRTLVEGSSVPRYNISAEWSDESDRRVRGDFALVVMGATVYVVGAVAVGNAFDRYEADFSRVIDSFEVTRSPNLHPLDTSAGLDALLDSIGVTVTEIRGLPPPTEIERRILSRQQLRSVVQGQLLSPDSLRDLEIQADLCLILDLCAEDDDLLLAMLSLLGKGVLGYYQPDEKSLTVVSDSGEIDPLAWSTYAHEFAHALQDETFDLASMGRAEDSFDSTKGLLALQEGDAKLSEYLFYDSLSQSQQDLLVEALEELIREFSRSPEAVSAPRFLQETFGWEHRVGTEFVYRLYLEGGFTAVNTAFLFPPRSTEQVIHFDKYLEGDLPHTVQLPDIASVLSGTWVQRETGVLGELLTDIYLGTFLSQDRASRAAAGWGGDRYALLKDDRNRLLIAMRFSWDSEEDATEFFEAYLDLVGEKSRGQWDLIESQDSLRLWTGEDISLYVSSDDKRSLVVIGPDVATVRSVLEILQQEG